MHHGAMGWDASRDRVSPFGRSVSPQSDVNLLTPPFNSPTIANTMSPLSRTLERKTVLDRARLFLEDRLGDLVRSMDDTGKRVVSTWLYQFWFFSFTTAKYWGRGPRDWTADALGFNAQYNPVFTPSPAMPKTLVHSLGQTIDRRRLSRPMPKPSALCCWSIHVMLVEFEEDSPPPEPKNAGLDKEVLGEWPEHWKQRSIQEVLRDNLESNDFSHFEENELPVAVPTIAKAARISSDELLEEALAFAIMGRNEELVADLLEKIIASKVDISSLHPLHLATSYLDGAKTCCNILINLCERLKSNQRDVYVNQLGHTVLDNLMMTILRAHTFISPETIDKSVRKDTPFVGEEI